MPVLRDTVAGMTRVQRGEGYLVGYEQTLEDFDPDGPVGQRLA